MTAEQEQLRLDLERAWWSSPWPTESECATCGGKAWTKRASFPLIGVGYSGVVSQTWCPHCIPMDEAYLQRVLDVRAEEAKR